MKILQPLSQGFKFLFIHIFRNMDNHIFVEFMMKSV